MKKETLKQHAYNIIKDKIINCEYAPSALLNEEMLKEDVQASRTPIRDALGRLEQEGLVTILPKKGIMVAPLTIREINMVHEARTLIEPFSILHYGNKISDEIYQKYFRIFQRDTTNVSDLNEYYETDKQFHQMFIDATGNDYLISTYERIAQQNTRLRIYSGRKSRNRLLASQQEHLKIVEYCLKQDWTLASKAMEEHLYHSKEASFEAAFHADSMTI